MHAFFYTKGELCCEQVSLFRIATQHGSPCYVYSQSTIEDHFQKLDSALSAIDHSICYAVKANSNLALIRTIAKLGGGFDVVSQGEIQRVVAAGGLANQCLFAGVGKRKDEIEFALDIGIYAFNAESEAELERIDSIAKRLGKKAPVSIRVNPNVDAQTHAKITTGTYENKFGIAFEEVGKIYEKAAQLPHLHLKGVQMHIGSQLTTTDPFEGAVRKLIPLVAALKSRYGIEFFSIGGGLGIIYDPALESGKADWWKRKEAANILTPQSYAARLIPLLAPLGLKILVEPGRFIAGNAGALITRVEYIKKTGQKNFVIVDAAMNDLLRPAFYEAHHEIVPLHPKGEARICSDVVGPICESGDTFCKNRMLPKVQSGDYLAILSAGAYAFVMASNYNTRPLPAEVMVKGKCFEVIRERQSPDSLWSPERIPAWLH